MPDLNIKLIKSATKKTTKVVFNLLSFNIFTKQKLFDKLASTNLSNNYM